MKSKATWTPDQRKKYIFESGDEDGGSCTVTSLQRHDDEETINKEQLAICNAAAASARTRAHAHASLHFYLCGDFYGTNAGESEPRPGVAAIWPGFVSSQAEAAFEATSWNKFFHLVDQKTRLGYGPPGLAFHVAGILH